jgi:hypothetical protein
MSQQQNNRVRQASNVSVHCSSLLPDPLGLKANFWLAFPVHDATLTTDPGPLLTCRHLPSITDVIVPFAFRDHAPLQSHMLAHPDFGNCLQPQLQFTAAPSPVAHASISQQPPLLAAAPSFTIVGFESPGLTPELSVHICEALPALHGTAAKFPPAGRGSSSRTLAD